MAAPVLNLLRTSRLPIIAQLRLEEALLRTSKENWMLINDGAVQPAIVLGISGCALSGPRPACAKRRAHLRQAEDCPCRPQASAWPRALTPARLLAAPPGCPSCCSKPDELIQVEQAIEAGIKVIRRFSGGGTVAVDHDTVFTTLIFQVCAGGVGAPGGRLCAAASSPAPAGPGRPVPCRPSSTGGCPGAAPQ
jgi:hypothetical protein